MLKRDVYADTSQFLIHTFDSKDFDLGFEQINHSSAYYVRNSLNSLGIPYCSKLEKIVDAQGKEHYGDPSTLRDAVRPVALILRLPNEADLTAMRKYIEQSVGQEYRDPHFKIRTFTDEDLAFWIRLSGIPSS